MASSLPDDLDQVIQKEIAKPASRRPKKTPQGSIGVGPVHYPSLYVVFYLVRVRLGWFDRRPLRPGWQWLLLLRLAAGRLGLGLGLGFRLLLGDAFGCFLPLASLLICFIRSGLARFGLGFFQVVAKGGQGFGRLLELGVGGLPIGRRVQRLLFKLPDHRLIRQNRVGQCHHVVGWITRRLPWPAPILHAADCSTASACWYGAVSRSGASSFSLRPLRMRARGICERLGGRLKLRGLGGLGRCVGYLPASDSRWQEHDPQAQQQR